MHHWRTAWRHDAAGKRFICQLDVKRASVNTLSEPVMRELNTCLKEAEREKADRVVLMSAKPSGFCFGANARSLELAGIDLAENLEEAHRVADRLDYFPGEVVALIHGICFGAGLELALACDYRIATPDARFAFPEVRFGLHPGLGASWRLPRQIAAPDALDMMLSGRILLAEAALHSRLIDEIVPAYMLEEAGARCTVKTASPFERIRSRAVVMRASRTAITAAARRRLRKQLNEAHDPAPFALLDFWEKAGDQEDILFAERASFVELTLSEPVKNRLRTFRLRGKLKTKAKSYTWHTRLPAVESIHVLGAGTMGSAIAAWGALQGYRVSLHDPDHRQIANAVAAAAKLFADKQAENTAACNAMDRLIPDPHNAGLAHARLIIEAVPEKLNLKRHVLADVETHAAADAIIATNTSSIPLEQLDFPQPERLVGLHFFNPVATMPLVEIVHGEHTQTTALAVVSVFAERIGKLPLAVKSQPGFLVSRVLTAWLLEAMLLHDEGYGAEDIDASAEHFGLCPGPLQTVDRMGLDTCLDVISHLTGVLPAATQTPDSLRRLLAEGRLGRKTGRGFFTYKNDKVVHRETVSETIPELIQTRLNLALLNTAVTCWREKIVDSQDELDAGMLFGADFPSFRGGPLHYLRASNPRQLLETLRSLADDYPRFQPDVGWEELVGGRET
jgi:3-hydroxyacyl-CoA dehydrogenase / enoyl-CoA hydratase / 3-hydroxybutyryl-CoA epimerase